MPSKSKKLPLHGPKSGPKAQQSKSSYAHWPVLAVAGIMIAAGLLAYHNSFGGPFIYDDINSIVENPNIRQLWPIWKLGWAGPAETVSGRPVLGLSLAVNYQISGLEVWSYHLFNLIIHILAGLVLFGIIRRTLLSKGLQQRFAKASTGLALVCALIWLVHPLQTQSVTYIVQRAESLMGLFYLLSLYCAIRGFSSEKSRRWYVAAIAACALGVGTKELVATAPLMILLYDRIFVSGSFKKVFAQRWGLYAGLAGTWVIFGALAWSAPRGASVTFANRYLTPWLYCITQCKVIVLYYLRLSFWPSRLVFEYGWPMARTLGEVAAYAAVLVGLLGGTMVAVWRWPRLGFLGVWFFVILAPTSSFLPIVGEVAAEHRMYLPLAAVIVAVVLCGYALAKRLLARLIIFGQWRTALWRVLGYILAGTAIVVLGLLTVRRNDVYRTALSIWNDTIEKVPGNSRAWNKRGLTYLSKDERDLAISDFDEAIELDRNSIAYYNRGVAYQGKGDLEQAVRDFDQAIVLDPTLPKAYNNRGVAYGSKGKYDQAIRDFAKAIELDSGYADAYYNRGFTYSNKGEYEQAIRDYNEVIKLNPKYTEAYYNRGVAYQGKGDLEQAIRDLNMAINLNPRLAAAYNNRGLAYSSKGEYDQAIRDFAKAIELNFAPAKAYSNRGLVYWSKGEYDQAIHDLNTAIKLNPRFAKAYSNRGLAYWSKGEYDQAIRDLNMAIKLNPDSVRAYNSLAWILATCPEAQIRDGAEAVRLAERACGLGNNRVPSHLDTLAAAYAELGQFDKAVKTAEKAMQLARAAQSEKLAKDIQNHLELYKAKRPYREPFTPQGRTNPRLKE